MSNVGDDQGGGCVRPMAASAIVEDEVSEDLSTTAIKEQMMIQVGEKAPDFSAPGYHNGAFVEGVKLSDYLGKWVLLCFYPGDFTFV